MSVKPFDEPLSETIAEYEHMDIKKVRAELKEANIDPAPTIAAVTRLIEDALATSGEPKKKR